MYITSRQGIRRPDRNPRGRSARRTVRGEVRDALMLAMDRDAGATLSELAGDVAAPTSSVQAALGRLVDEGLVRADGGRYALTVDETFRLGVLYLAASRLGRATALR